MIVPSDEPIRGIDIGPERFKAILAAGRSPATDEAEGIYQAIVSRGVRPLVALAFFWHESTLGRAGITLNYATRGIGNVRSPANPENGGEIIQTERGPFVRYPTWEAGARDWADRLRGPIYEGAGLTTVVGVIPTYAPSSDGNDPTKYIEAVLDFIRAQGSIRLDLLPGLIDLRWELKRNPQGGPRSVTLMSQKRWAVIHFFGPPVTATDPVAYFRSIAIDHAFNRDWGTEPGITHGDGIMYTLGFDQAGHIYQLRDWPEDLWHCGTELNRLGYALHAMIGGDQVASDDLLRSLWTACSALRLQGVPRKQVVGHVELRTTGTCPGTLLGDFVVPWRANMGEETRVADGQWFRETGHFVGGGFWRFWQANGGLAVLGLPLTDEQPGHDEAGAVRTVQWFERARLEHWPENPDPFKVQASRLGSVMRAGSTID